MVLQAVLEAKECILLEYFSIEIDTYRKWVSWFLIWDLISVSLQSQLFPPVKWGSKLLKLWIVEPCMTSILFIPPFSLCEACQHYCFQLVYMLVAEMICKTASNINTGRLRNMYSEIQQHSCVKKSLSKSCYGLHKMLFNSISKNTYS